MAYHFEQLFPAISAAEAQELQKKGVSHVSSRLRDQFVRVFAAIGTRRPDDLARAKHALASLVESIGVMKKLTELFSKAGMSFDVSQTYNHQIRKRETRRSTMFWMPHRAKTCPPKTRSYRGLTIC